MCEMALTQLLQCALFLCLHILNPCNCILHPDGKSTVSRYQDDSGNYQFDYTVASNDGEHFHKSGTDPLGRVVGSYGMTLADGRSRLVDYVADKNGFRAHIRSNEPGIVSGQSADATIEKTDVPAFLPESQKLELAASNSGSENTFGERLKYTSSKVTYMRPNENEDHRRENNEEDDNEEHYNEKDDNEEHDNEKDDNEEHDNEKDDNEEEENSDENDNIHEPVKSATRRKPLRSDELFDRSKNFEDRPFGQVPDFGNLPKNIPLSRLPPHNTERFPQINHRISLSRGYNLPLNPSTAVRSPEFQGPLPPNAFYPARPTSLPEPSTPPYGGFNFKPLTFSSGLDFKRYPDGHQFPTIPTRLFSYNNERGNRYPDTINPGFTYDKEGKYPSVTMSTVHGGFTGYYPYTSPEHGDEYGVRYNYPSRRPFTTPTNFQTNYGRRIIPDNAGTKYPSVAPGKPNLTLRAVAIPNGIQAVPVDPATGQVHNHREFRPYDSTFGTQNDDRYHAPSKPIQKHFSNFPPVYENPLQLTPAPEKSPSHYSDSFDNSRQPQRPDIRPETKKYEQSRLSKPSSKDLALINRVFEHVNSQHRQSGNTPGPYHFDSQAFQPDPPPDYPPTEIAYRRPRAQSDVHKYDFEDDGGHYYKPESKDYSEEPIRAYRPSVAVRLPVYNKQPTNYGNNREYRSAPENKYEKQIEDEIVPGDNDDKAYTT